MKYNIIYVDPPWEYRDRKLIRKDGKKPSFGVGAINHYELINIEKIYNLNIQSLCAENCALFLWTCPPLLDIGIECLKRWGFRFVGKAFNWVKTYPSGKPSFGVGYYTKSNSEDCILGIKGKMKPISNSVSSAIITVHPRYLPDYKHSKKPDIFPEKIVELFGDLPRIEIFARRKLPGWDATGLEYDGKDIVEFLKKYSDTDQNT